MVLIADTGPPDQGETAGNSMLALQQTVPSLNFQCTVTQLHHLSYSNHEIIQPWLSWPTMLSMMSSMVSMMSSMVTRSVFTLRIVCTLASHQLVHYASHKSA